MTATETTGFPICIDSRMLRPEGSGVRRYAHALFDALSHLPEAPGPVWRLEDAHIEGVWGQRGRLEMIRRSLESRARWPVRVRAGAGETLFGRDVFRRAQSHFRRHGTLLDVAVTGLAPGIMHWTYPVPIRLSGWANLYTVHDAIPLTAPELTAIDPDRHRRLLTAIGASAAAVLTVSEHARIEIAATGTINSACLVDCGLSVIGPDAAAKLPAGLTPDGFFLAIGSLEPRKNLARLVRAWQQAGTSRPLVLVGPEGDVLPEAQAVLSTPGLIRLGYQTDAVLAALLRDARALLFPSLSEGFGLPIVEAMAAGTAVMTSAGGATEEVAGGAALLVDPRDTAAMAAGIAQLDADDPLCARLAAAGRGRASAFTSARFGERLAAVHARVLADLPLAPDRRV